MTDTLTGAPARNYIGGEWRVSAAGDTYEKRSPWRPSVVTGVYPASDADDARAAVAAAGDAYPGWSSTPAPTRAAYFTKAAAAIEARAEQVAQDMTAEMGKPIREARMETLRAAQILRYAAGEAWRPIGEMYEPSVADQRLYTLRRSLGVVGLITPWNFPIAIPVWKLAPALIYGNTLVLKLGYEAPRTGLHVAECFAEAGLPAGVLNVLTGSGSKVGAEIVSNAGVRAISFTGSVPVGRSVRDEATARNCRVQLELGGHNPLIVSASAELDRAVEAAYAGAFWSAGQKCTATRRILVDDSVYETFRDKLLARVTAGRVGDPTDAETEVGPVVNESAMVDVLGAIERARDDDGTVLAGGERTDDEGFLIAPTVFEGLADDAELSCEEVFGPVTSLYRYATFDEAIERANAVPFGLSAGIFTRDLRETQRFTSEIQSGIVHVNSQTAGADVHVPFGGLKGSAWGPHEQGRAAIDFYTESVTVYQDAPLAERTLVTGALGCLGAWTLKALVGLGEEPVGFDLGSDDARLRLVLSAEERAHVTLVEGDVTDAAAVAAVLDDHGITNVVHLAAMQVPFVRSDPERGARVNVHGTVVVFEAIKARLNRIRGVAYASSTAVYNVSDHSPAPESGGTEPSTLYGVFKLANEGTARVYWNDDDVASIGIRPYIVYGPGRDQGLTSGPSLAMEAAARGEGYTIAYGGTAQYDFAPDVGRAFARAARAATDGAHVANFPGVPSTMQEVVDAIESAAPAVAGRVFWEEGQLPFPEALEGRLLERLIGPLTATPLTAGVGATIEHFRAGTA